MSCGQIAFERAGISVEKYYASEIDKFAIQVTQKNFPGTIQLGSITDWQSWNIDKPDIIIGGSPCQGFSFAGKQLNFEDERSKLFFVFIDILKHYKPKYFLLENVVMAKEHNDVISEILGNLYPECVTQAELFRTGRLEPILINSALISAQNRRRLYWTNIQGITQPKDKGILLKDIIKDTAFINNNGTLKIQEEKSNCIDANYHKGIDNHGQRTMAMSTVAKDSVLCYTDNYIQYDLTGKGHGSQDMRIFFKDNKSNCINVSHSSIPKLKEGETEKHITWRKLTPLECERLQTVPDRFSEKGLDIHCQPLYFGNECEVQNICKKFVESKDVINQSQIGKLNFAINTIFEKLEMGQLILKENLSIKTQNVSIKDARGIVKLLSVFVSCIIKDGNENSLITEINHVRFVLNQSEMGQTECVLLTIRDGKETVLLKLIQQENMNLMETKEENIIKMEAVDLFITLLRKKYLEEKSGKEKSYIILTLINLIIAQAIFLCVKQTAVIYLSIDSLNRLRGNLLEMELSFLKMENIVKISNSARYKLLGNGWTVDVVAHIFRTL